jgi:hypothetical protein
MVDPEFGWWRSWISAAAYQWLNLLTQAFVITNWALIFILYNLS